MTIGNLLVGLRTHGFLVLHTLEKRGVHVISAQISDPGWLLKVQVSSEARQQLGRVGRYVPRTSEDYPFEAEWQPDPSIRVYALLDRQTCRELGLLPAEGAQAAPAAAAR